MPSEPLPAEPPYPDALHQLRSTYADKCQIIFNEETKAWEAVWYPTPTTTCLLCAPDLATLAAKLNAEGWATA